MKLALALKAAGARGCLLNKYSPLLFRLLCIITAGSLSYERIIALFRLHPTDAVIPFDLILTSFSGCEAAGERRSSKSAFSAALLLADGLLGNSSGSLLSCRIKPRESVLNLSWVFIKTRRSIIPSSLRANNQCEPRRAKENARARGGARLRFLAAREKAPARVCRVCVGINLAEVKSVHVSIDIERTVLKARNALRHCASRSRRLLTPCG